jgi:hypothetical protein
MAVPVHHGHDFGEGDQRKAQRPVPVEQRQPVLARASAEQRADQEAAEARHTCEIESTRC